MPSSQVMTKFKAGQLHSGGPGGPVVTNPKQAVAIQYSERRKEKATGSADSLARRQVASTREMARLAKQSGFNMVASNLGNLADRRETAADETEKPKRIRPVRRISGG